MLERFGGYTLSSLMEEDARLLQLMRIVDEQRMYEQEVSEGGE